MPTIKALPLIPVGTAVAAYPLRRRVGTTSRFEATAVEMERQNGIKPSGAPAATATVNGAGEAVFGGLRPGAYVMHGTVAGDKLETVAGRPVERERFVSFKV